MLLMMRDLGITTQNMFALPEYISGFNNSSVASETVPLWGAVIDMDGETNLKRPQYYGLQLANSAILPTMLATTVSGTNPTWTQPLSTNDSIQLNNAHYLQSFAFTNGTQHSVVVFNLSRSGSLPVTFSGANAPSGSVLINQLTSTNPTDNNEGIFTNNPVVAGPTQTSASNFNPAALYSLPPYSMTVFVWPAPALPASTTTLQASPTSATPGQNVTLTATVTAQSGTFTPTGTVTFHNGTTSLGTATLDASGVATLSTTTLPTGSDSITASYGGDIKDSSSVSQAVTVLIAQSTVGTGTTTSLSASATRLTPGQSVTFTATVAPQSGSNVPTGTVTFLDGTASLGTAQLNASGVAKFSSTSLAVGTNSITAVYGGDSKDTGSSSTAVSVTVTAAPSGALPTTTTLTASGTQLTTGQSVSLTAVVAPQSGSNVPTGIVTFLDGTTSLGTAPLTATGGATLNLASLPVGTNSISAAYGGDTNDSPSTSAVVTVTVGAPEYAMVISSPSVSLTPGQPSTLTVTLIPENGFNLPISLSCSGLPSGTSCSFNPAIVTPSGAAVMSTVTMMAPVQMATSSKQAPHGVPGGRLAFGWVMPWGFIPLLGLAKKRRRSQLARWCFRLAVVAALTAGSLWVSGCGYSGNGSAFNVTITAAASNALTHTSQVTVNIQ